MFFSAAITRSMMSAVSSHFVSPRPLGRLAGECLEDARADVAGLVDAVAEAHDPLLAGQGVASPLLGRVRPAGGEQDVHHLLVGAAVQRTLERADRARDAGVQVARASRR